MSDILFGFVTALAPINLLAACLSVSIGIIIGALPGLSAAMGVALLIPITFGMRLQRD
ncbi:Tripartite tricarboxylate transporter TctA family [Fusobacterium necrophorum subsp. necrophorum]|nr:Tripartite tricarboxylate transporter TctA family [Fusobacterium necrophorum subsp. necrophorum]